jgi:uncharacterized protein (DUF3084 family)
MADEIGTIQDLLEGRISLTQAKGEAMANEKDTDKGTAENKTHEGAAAVEEKETKKEKAPTGKDNPAADNSGLEGKIDTMISQNEKVLANQETILTENKDLKAKTEKLQSDNADLKAKNAKLADEPDEGKTPKTEGMGDDTELGW